MDQRACGNLIEPCLFVFQQKVQIAKVTVVHEIFGNIFRIAIDWDSVEGFDDIARRNCREFWMPLRINGVNDPFLLLGVTF